MPSRWSRFLERGRVRAICHSRNPADDPVMIGAAIVTRVRAFPYGGGPQNCLSAALFSFCASAAPSASASRAVACDCDYGPNPLPSSPSDPYKAPFTRSHRRPDRRQALLDPNPDPPKNIPWHYLSASRFSSREVVLVSSFTFCRC